VIMHTMNHTEGMQSVSNTKITPTIFTIISVVRIPNPSL
jgi:hypothetical protein